MKKNTLLVLLLIFITLNAFAQAPKYALFEHFTNTRCGTCGATNPGFFANISINTNPKLHHISIHPSIPYSNCVFYQANTVPQDERATFYNLPGTPRVAINGANTVNANSVTAASVDNAYCATCSPVALQVIETDNGSGSRTATIKVRSVGVPPSGSFKLYAAIVEKTVNYNAPNTETVHHNVFRQFLTAASGDGLTLALQGNETNVTFNYTVNAAWMPSEVYVLTWLQNATTKEVVNSGTKFDALLLPIELANWSGQSEGTGNRLTWKTLSESNTDYFEIERSDDSKNFISVGNQKAAGESKIARSYSFVDKTANQATPQYYRLKTVDLDGTFALSSVISVNKTEKGKGQIQIFPNPTKDFLSYKMLENDSETTEITLVDLVGRVVLTQKLSNTEGGLSVTHLKPGTYIACLKTADTIDFSKVIIQ